jgi:hypothetical protein
LFCSAEKHLIKEIQMKKLIYLLVLIPLLIGCGPTSASSAVGSTCDTLQPTTADVQYVLNFGKDLFTNAVWSRSYTVQEQEAIVSWTHRSVASLADVSMLLFCEENGTADLELYFNNDTLKDKFANYDSVNVTASCSNEDVTLYELDTVEEGFAYTIHQWLQPMNESRLLSVVVVFPKEETALLEKYSQSFFPALPACQ